MHDARTSLAVRLDIRPRLVLPPERRAAKRRRFRLPPLALPATGYWLAMGALTYVFAHLGAHPLDSAEASLAERAEPAVLPAPPAELPGERAEPAAAPASLPPAEAAPANEPVAAAEPTTTDLAPALAAPRQEERETRENREPGRRGDFWGSRARESDEREEPAKREEPAQVAMSFPEFTDSSRPPKREHAGDGPRIDSLFEKADERPQPDAQPDAPTPPETAPDARGPVSSCEAAIARNNEQITIGAARGAADITRDAYASILQNGRYLAACSVPERTVFEICAAVKEGRAVGITVVSSPASPALNACVRGAVARVKFPSNQHLDVTHTRFDAVHR